MVRINPPVMTQQMIESKVNAWFNQNPPEGGKPPSDQQVAQAVSSYLAANPVRNGEDGQDGASPTDEQIQDAVSEHLLQHPPRPGEPGKDANDQQVMAAVSNFLMQNPPAAGKSVELRSLNGFIQFRQEGGQWANLVSLESLAGPRGPSSIVQLPNVTIAQSAAVAIQAGIRTITISGVNGVKAGDALLLIPVSDLPAGYAIHNCWSAADNAVKVTLTAPLLAIGANYSIICKLVALR